MFLSVSALCRLSTTQLAKRLSFRTGNLIKIGRHRAKKGTDVTSSGQWAVDVGKLTCEMTAGDIMPLGQPIKDKQRKYN